MADRETDFATQSKGRTWPELWALSININNLRYPCRNVVKVMGQGVEYLSLSPAGQHSRSDFIGPPFGEYEYRDGEFSRIVLTWRRLIFLSWWRWRGREPRTVDEWTKKANGFLSLFFSFFGFPSAVLVLLSYLVEKMLRFPALTQRKNLRKEIKSKTIRRLDYSSSWLYSMASVSLYIFKFVF